VRLGRETAYNLPQNRAPRTNVPRAAVALSSRYHDASAFNPMSGMYPDETEVSKTR